MDWLIIRCEIGIAPKVMIGVLQQLGRDLEITVDGAVFILEGVGEHPVVGLIAVEDTCQATMIDAGHTGVDET